MATLSFLSFLLAFAAVSGDWISFPLTFPLNGNQIIWNFDSNLQLLIGPIFQLVIGGGVIFLILRKFTVSIILLCSALVILLLLPWYSGFIHTDWLLDYTLQSQERLEIYQFFQNYFTPNFNSEPTFIPIRQFESLNDQVNIAFAMLGGGWYFALIGNLVLLGILLHEWRFSFKFLIMPLLILGLWIIPIQQSALLLLESEKLHNEGDKSLLNGQANLALNYYSEALKYNHALSLSTTFLIKISDTYNNIGNPLGQITKAWHFIQKAHTVGKLKKILLYQETRKILRPLFTLHKPLNNLDKALFNLGKRLYIRSWKYEGLIEFSQNNFNNALQAFLRSNNKITNQIYLADTYLKLENTQEALSILKLLVETVAHPDIKANIFCTIGDAYIQAKLPDTARKAYTNCLKLDGIKNFRAVKALTGF